MIYDNEIEAKEKFDKLLRKLDPSLKDRLIWELIHHDKDEVYIQETPIYRDVEYQGHLVGRYIADVKYAICVINKATAIPDEVKRGCPHIISLSEDYKVLKEEKER